jgi:hypothetical protein
MRASSSISPVETGGADATRSTAAVGEFFFPETTYPLFDQGFLRLAAVGDFFDE